MLEARDHDSVEQMNKDMSLSREEFMPCVSSLDVPSPEPLVQHNAIPYPMYPVNYSNKQQMGFFPGAGGVVPNPATHQPVMYHMPHFFQNHAGWNSHFKTNSFTYPAATVSSSTSKHIPVTFNKSSLGAIRNLNENIRSTVGHDNILSSNLSQGKRKFSESEDETDSTCDLQKKQKTSKYKGVFWGKAQNHWVARKMVKGKSKHLGYFRDEKEAARAWDIDTLAHKGSRIKGKLNFPDSIKEKEKYDENPSAYFKTRKQKRQAERTSKYIGVCWHRSNKAWKVSILINKVNTHVGYYDNEEEAARSYDAQALLYKPGTTKLNFPNAQIANK